MVTRTRAPQYPVPAWRERALDLLFPPTCVHCRRVGRWICAECWHRVPWSIESRCGTCGRPWLRDPCAHCTGGHPSLDSIVAVAEHEGAARDAVHALKYYGRHAISSMMGRVMSDGVTAFPIDVVVPVSLHSSRRRERGYDQAAMLAQAVARSLDLVYDGSVLQRVRRTRQQATLDARARQRNVEGAFEATMPPDGETVLLVDDVITTGATMEAAATALKDSGANLVHGIAFSAAMIGQDSLDTP